VNTKLLDGKTERESRMTKGGSDFLHCKFRRALSMFLIN